MKRENTPEENKLAVLILLAPLLPIAMMILVNYIAP